MTQKAESAPNAVAVKKAPTGRAKQRPAIQTSIPRYNLNPPPHYPRLAERRHYTGTVILDVRVTAYGRVAQIRIAESSGYDILDQSALKSVQGWQFKPARQEDRPVEMWVKVPIRYELQ
jgi:protein TonB